jgi:hypothetical protein
MHLEQSLFKIFALLHILIQRLVLSTGRYKIETVTASRMSSYGSIACSSLHTGSQLVPRSRKVRAFHLERPVIYSHLRGTMIIMRIN